MNSIEGLIQGKRVLITGAGGSIGSNWFNNVYHFNHQKLFVWIMAKKKIFELMSLNERTNSNTIIKPILGDINLKNQVEKVFYENRPQIVFHAAAYKHVPIQETHPWSAVKTNVAEHLQC